MIFTFCNSEMAGGRLVLFQQYNVVESANNMHMYSTPPDHVTLSNVDTSAPGARN